MPMHIWHRMACIRPLARTAGWPLQCALRPNGRHSAGSCGPPTSATTRVLPRWLSASGTVRLPGSKSISNRVLLLSALALILVALLVSFLPTAILLLTLILIGCEVLPKTLAVRRPEQQGAEDQ